MKSILDMGRESQDPEMLGGPDDPDVVDEPRWSLPLWTLTAFLLLSVGVLGGYRLVILAFERFWDETEPVYVVDDSSAPDISRNPLTWEGFRFTVFCLVPLVVVAALVVLVWRFRPHIGQWRSVWKWPIVGLTVVAVPVTVFLTLAVWLFAV